MKIYVQSYGWLLWFSKLAETEFSMPYFLNEFGVQTIILAYFWLNLLYYSVFAYVFYRKSPESFIQVDTHSKACRQDVTYVWV